MNMNNVTEINKLVNIKSDSKREMMDRIAREYYNAGLNVYRLRKERSVQTSISNGRREDGINVAG